MFAPAPPRAELVNKHSGKCRIQPNFLLRCLALVLCICGATLVFAEDLGGDDELLSDEELLLDDEDLLGDDELLADDDLLGEEDLLSVSDEVQEEAADVEGVDAETADKLHQALFVEERFPSAATCANCHPKHYREWSVSQHAYAQLSPIFNSMHGTILKLTNGTNGDFCIRCHTPVGMILGEDLFMPNAERSVVSREGVTCVGCHRVNEAYGKISGRIRFVEGDISTPIFGPSGNTELERVLADPKFRVVTSAAERGQTIHSDAPKFFQLTTSGFCGTCHDVTLINGFRLEEAFSEYKSAPAAKNGVSCQDCHMGVEPGISSGYAEGPAAIVNDVATRPRKLTDHMFAGPDYSIVHPGIFPHNPDAAAIADIPQWVTFDDEAGWGTEEFEGAVPADYEFPSHWRSRTRRKRARRVLDQQKELLAEIEKKRLQVLQAGYQIGEVVTERADPEAIEFRVQVRNATDGHGVPTGFDAERLVFLRVTVTDAEGAVVFRSGDLDPNGDLRDSHSLYVHNNELPLDEFLFSLQTKFVVRMQRGGEREQVLAVNYSPDPLPFVRPQTRAAVLVGRPRGARKHKQNIEPNGHRWATYKVREDQLTGNPPYTAEIELVAGMVPVNLVNEVKGVGFDYGMNARQIAEAVVAGHQVVASRVARFDLND